MKCFAIVLIGLLFASGCVATDLLAIVTDFGPNNQKTIVRSVSINAETGAMTDITTNFIYAGSSGTFDGISAFDQSAHVFYYATDFATKFIYAVNEFKKQIDPTIAFPGTLAVTSLAIDVPGKALIASLVDSKKVNTVVVYPLTAARMTGFDLPSGVNPGKTIVDKDLLYNVAPIQSTTDSLLSAFSLKTPVSKANFTTHIKNTHQISKLWIDPTPPKADFPLWGFAESFVDRELKYYFVNINVKTGESTVAEAISGGIVTSVAFAPTKGVVYYSDATNEGIFLRSHNLRTHVSANVSISHPLEDFAISHE